MAEIIRTQIVIIGAGFGGIGMAIRLKQSGINDFIILERDPKIGGTWRDNTYPGAACDVSSHLYSFSFEPNPGWSRMFSPHNEIQDYMYHCYNKYNLAPFTHLGENVDSMAFDDEQALWIVHTASGKQYHAQFLVNAMGPLNRAVTPDIKGLENFKGTTFHSSYWNHAYDLTNKKVAVIGTGASAIQIVPNIVNEVKELHLFQRTAPWIIPKRDRAMKEWEKRLFKTLPFTQRWLRNKVYLINELTAIGMVINPGI
jgi:cation diffusion facilitator CzcD-associated flavoprotein CzcO